MPAARELAEIMAMAASLFIFPLSVILRRKKAANTTTGMDTPRGAHPAATAMDRAPKDTWDSPSPIMEYRFRTRLTPKRAAHREIRIPPMRARTKNG